MDRSTAMRNRAFSLLELVIVVVIIGIIAAIAVPRLSRGAEGAADAALLGNLAVLRNAIDLYATEHPGKFPTKADIGDQLTLYTDEAGDAAAKDSTHIYGPYVRKVPPLPVGAMRRQTGIADVSGATIGWIYDETTGDITANCTNGEKDAAGKQYNQY